MGKVTRVSSRGPCSGKGHEREDKQVHEKDDFEKSLSIFDDSSEPSRAESIKVDLEGNNAL